MRAVPPELIREALRKTGRAVLHIATDSMAPALPAGCQIEVEIAAPEQLRPGDIALIAAGSALVTHRIVAHNLFGSRRWFLQKGDATAPVGLLAAAQIVGRAVARLDGGARTSLDAAAWRARNRALLGYCALLSALLPGAAAFRERLEPLPPRHPVRRVCRALGRLCLLPLRRLAPAD